MVPAVSGAEFAAEVSVDVTDEKAFVESGLASV
jgi:hypothetical protein